MRTSFTSGTITELWLPQPFGAVVRRHRCLLGLAVGVFFIAVFPGNISQFIDGHDAFGLNSDRARRNRLFFQPVLVAWAWWSTDAFALVRRSGRTHVEPGDE